MKCTALALAGAFLSLTLRKRAEEFSVLIGIAVLTMMGVLTLELLKPVMTFAEALQDRAKLSRGLMAPVIKTLAVGLLTRLGTGICEDAGEKALGQALSLAGGAAAFYCLLPLLQGVLDLLDRMI